jgi:hypothetical protein
MADFDRTAHVDLVSDRTVEGTFDDKAIIFRPLGNKASF